MEKDSYEWILHLEGLQIRMNEFGQKGNITDEDFIIHLLNNFPHWLWYDSWQAWNSPHGDQGWCADYEYDSQKIKSLVKKN